MKQIMFSALCILLLVDAVNAQVNTPKQDPSENMETYNNMYFPCSTHAATRDYYLVNSADQFEELIATNCEWIEGDTVSYIDFTKFTLFGTMISFSGCNYRPNARLFITTSSEETIHVAVEVIEEGICRPLFRSTFWFVIPKIDDQVIVQVHKIEK